MTVQEAIEKSIEGGYVPFHVEEDACEMEGKEIAHAIMDISFWQSLGKVMGWNLKKWTDDIPGKQPEILTPDWLVEWHRFIDHISQGKSIEEYFEKL